MSADGGSQPRGEVISDAPLVYFSSASGNTRRMAERLSLPSVAIRGKGLVMTRPFILMTPSFADAGGNGAVPKPVIRFLNEVRNRELLRGVIGTGNRNFGEFFAIGGREVARKCGVPCLYCFELSGTSVDAAAIENGVRRFLEL